MGATGTVAQLGERRTEDAEAAGSSPASPTKLLLIRRGHRTLRRHHRRTSSYHRPSS